MYNELTITKGEIYACRVGMIDVEEGVESVQVRVSDGVFDIIMYRKFEDSQEQMKKVFENNQDK